MRKTSQKSGSTQWIVTGILSVAAIGGGGVMYSSNQHVPKVEPGTVMNGVALGGLTLPQARQKIEDYWKTASQRELTLTSNGLKEQPGPMLAADLGISLDTEATLKLLKTDNFWIATSRAISQAKPTSRSVEPVFKFDETKLEVLKAFVKQNETTGEKARVFFEGDQIVRQPEKPGMKLDEAKLGEAVMAAFMSGDQGTIPMIEAPKRVQDEDLDKVRTVIATYRTRFSEGNRPRSANIRLAAKIINGTLLLPGESFSFNGVIGRRTAARGFKEAGVLVSGRHDFDIGGGICQVSTTLYNAVLRADLEIGARSPHSLPVPYVPMGQDAAVSFPQPDFSFTNNRKEPIAIMATVGGGAIEFRILGYEKLAGEVKIIHRFLGSVALPEKVINDPSLPPGTEKVEEKGAPRRSVQSWRIVTVDGVEVERTNLGVSTYRGAGRIIRVNRAPKPVTPETTPETPAADPASAPVPAAPKPAQSQQRKEPPKKKPTPTQPSGLPDTPIGG